jgi:hypothetical protein
MSTPEEVISFGEPHSWQPQSLIARAAVPPEPPTIGGVLYPGKRTLLSGETESLKTWFALILSKAEMDAGYPVAWADLDAMGPGELLARLQALGVADEVIHELFLYYEPEERLVDELLEEVCGTIGQRGIRLFVIDAFNPILNLHGLDPGNTSDIETFWREVASPITATGAAPALIDHVTKNAEARGKYAIGSERKASGAIVHLGFQATQPFMRGGTGRTILRTHKDRPGFLPRPTIGRLVLRSDGYAVTYELEEDKSQRKGRFRPTVYMYRVSIKLESEVEARSKNWIEENVDGKAEPIRLAIDTLVDEGYLHLEVTSRGHYFTSVRPYREADDQDSESEPRPDVVHDSESSSLPRPKPVPDLRSIPDGERLSTSSPTSSRPRPTGRGSPDLVPSSPSLGRDEDEAGPDLVPLPLVAAVDVPELPPDAPEWERDYWRRRQA